MKRLFNYMAFYFEKYEPFHQSLILIFLSGPGSIALLTVILMII
jgi:hypothetical protein